MLIQLPNFENIRILVAGDVMLDRYWFGDTTRISPEAPIPVVQVSDFEERPGGAANVALNIAALHAKAYLLGYCGFDAAAEALEAKLLSAGVQFDLQKIERMRTTTKIRILSQQQQLIRLDFDPPDIPLDSQWLLARFDHYLPETDIVLLSDYAKGTLAIAPDLIQRARQANVPVFVDPKCQDFQRYQGATLVTPNLKEFEAIVGHCPDEQTLITKANQLIQQYQFDALLVTQGSQGMTLVRPGQAALHLPAHLQEICDVTGAGDTTIAVLALSFSANQNWEQAVSLANLAASQIVTKLGAAAITPVALKQAIPKYATDHVACLTEDQLLFNVAAARKQGERIVMTSGCFDLLHPGHITYLAQAKALGDRLIVAVNDDASVAQLKPSRPINVLSARMAVLAALQAVDWVIAFSDTTPARLIQRLQPDIWVKGGDYQLEDLPEASIVNAYGGELRCVDFVPSCSTTTLIHKIQSLVVS